MTCLTRVLITSPLTVAGFKSIVDLAPGQLPAINNFHDFVGGCIGGNYSGIFAFKVGAIQATGAITSTGAATAAETLTVCNVVFTARASGASGNEFNLSATVGTQATNIATAINASADLTGIVTASAALGVVTVTSVVPGLIGNGLALSDAMTNVACTAFASGTDGTAYTISLQ